ncbi:MAG: SGNH/GDSL hydrolase family protein [Candidatus Omnitrophota bacterium]
MKKPRNPQLLKKSIIIYLIILPVTILILLELAVKILFPTTFQSLFTHSTKQWVTPDTSIESFFSTSNFIKSKITGYKLTPNSPLGTNSLGMLDTPRMKHKPKECYRIICVGDSTTARPFHHDLVYPTLLEQLLNKQKQEKYFEVWNCAVPGYNSIQYCNATTKQWINFDPDLVIIGFCLNDFGTTPILVREKGALIGYFPNREIITKVNPFLLQHSALYRILVIKILSLKHSESKDIIKISAKKFYETKKILDKKNIELLIVIFGFPKNFDSYELYFKQSYSAIKKIIADYDINYIDMVPAFEANGPKSFVLFEGDEIHFNKKASTLIAEKIYSYLNK